MGRADIATLSEISFGVRLCLHPSAQRRGRRVMPKFLNAHPSRFLSHHVGRDAPLRVLERALGHLIALFSFSLRFAGWILEFHESDEPHADCRCSNRI